MFFGDLVEKCIRIQLNEGDTFLLPGGKITSYLVGSQLERTSFILFYCPLFCLLLPSSMVKTKITSTLSCPRHSWLTQEGSKGCSLTLEVTLRLDTLSVHAS